MTKSAGDCGSPCAELNDRQKRVHLLYLDGVGMGECYRLTADPKKKQPTEDTCNTQGPRMVRLPHFQAAIDYHRRHDAVKYAANKERSVQRMDALAEHATLERFATVTSDGTIQLIGWEGKDGDEIRGLASIEQKPDGTIKIKVRDPVAAERLLGDFLGWKEAEKEDPAIVAESEARTKLLEALTRRSEAGK